MNSDGSVIDGLIIEGGSKESEFLKQYQNLPIRQHVKIDNHGTAVSGAKFDEQVVYAGSRFCFELEMVAKQEDDKQLFELAIKYSQRIRRD